MDTRPSYRDKYSIVIPAAGIGRRMKIYGPKSLIKIQDEKTIISRSLEYIDKSFKQYEIIVVGGYQINKLREELRDDVKIKFNPDYETKNVADSLRIGIEEATTDKVLVIYGDLIFNEECINLPFRKESAIVICNSMQKHEVGCIVENNYLQHIFYQLPNKWAQIAYFTGKELELMKKLINDKKTKMWFGFEVINEILTLGGKFKVFTPEKGKAIDIDSSYDLKFYYENFN